MTDPSAPKPNKTLYESKRQVFPDYIFNPSKKDIEDMAKEIAGRSRYGIRFGVFLNKKGGRTSAIWDSEWLHEDFEKEVMAPLGYAIYFDRSFSAELDLKRQDVLIGMKKKTINDVYHTLSSEFTLEEAKQVEETIKRSPQ